MHGNPSQWETSLESYNIHYIRYMSMCSYVPLGSVNQKKKYCTYIAMSKNIKNIPIFPHAHFVNLQI